MTLKFLGTRGEIEVRSKRHKMHSSLLIGDGCEVMIDCGTDWSGRIGRLRPAAILLTHAHSDHAAGLKRGSPCPVFASAATWEILKRYPIASRHVILPYETFEIGHAAFEGFHPPLPHNARRPVFAAGGGCLQLSVDLVVALLGETP